MRLGRSSQKFVRRMILPIRKKEEHLNDVSRKDPEVLRREAAEKLAYARRLEAEANAMFEEAREVTRVRATLDGLTTGTQSGKVNKMTPEQRHVRSASNVDSDDAFMTAVHLKFTSLREFATKLGVTASFLSQCRSGKKNMPPRLAERIEDLIEYPVSAWKR